jgi:glycosyltransferase involved in cell wall biosynthesis
MSVAMCTYNGERFLTEQLQSLLAQQRLPDEVVICDDGSVDRTLEILDQFAQDASFPVRVIRNTENLGYARNFQQAVALTSGDLIALADQDDFWYPQKLHRIEELFDDPAIGGVFSNGDLIDTASQPIAGNLWDRFQFSQKEQRRFYTDGFNIILRHNVVTGMAFAFRRSVREYLQWLPPFWPHDAWLGLLLVATGQLHVCPEHLVAYRTHDNQQIGVPQTVDDKQMVLRKDGIAAYRKRSREHNLRAYQKDVFLLEGLLESPAATIVTPWRDEITGKIMHSQRGIAQLENPFWKRWLSVLSHWSEYQRYAPTGISALVRDLVI